MPDRIEGYRLDVGLEGIGTYTEPAQRMPAQSEARLTGEPVPQQLDALFPRDTVNAVMRDFARPKVTDASVLLPTHSEVLIRQAASELRSEADTRSDEVLTRAADVLDRHRELCDLLHKNRAALLTA